MHPTGTGPNNIHDSVLEDDVSVVPNIKALFEEQDEKENVQAESKIMLFSPSRKSFKFGSTAVLSCGHHCRTLCGLQFPLTNISCQSPNLYHTHKCTHNVVQDYKS
jgi:hypothetical protein